MKKAERTSMTNCKRCGRPFKTRELLKIPVKEHLTSKKVENRAVPVDCLRTIKICKACFHSYITGQASLV